MSNKKELTQQQKDALNTKLEVAEELGLLEKIEQVGFGGLTSCESGRIGGIISKRKKEQQKRNSQL